MKTICFLCNKKLKIKTSSWLELINKANVRICQECATKIKESQEVKNEPNN